MLATLMSGDDGDSFDGGDATAPPVRPTLRLSTVIPKKRNATNTHESGPLSPRLA